jgi:hypothetical protein
MVYEFNKGIGRFDRIVDVFENGYKCIYYFDSQGHAEKVVHYTDHKNSAHHHNPHYHNFYARYDADDGVYYWTPKRNSDPWVE